ncbi:DNA replication checkpoint mediator [Purpureocillium lavendulum]|uniref:DNA replication checkpoint mediator n=1 Tax=Purpureocillium lavendulum TaxID=1247861 RepID=A0AB34FWD7_9HYPO|nr:DNA replication checkpoint mediator [Purpureocillium lavendulum]
MASSRASSPASREASPEQLTPRSKIKALLATVESSDDEGEVGASRTSANGSPTKKPNVQRRGDQQLPRADSMNNSDSDDSDVAVRPRGKLASRMQGNSDAPKEPETRPDAPETARERVRKMLEREAAVEATATREEDADAEDDDELPVAPRRLKRRAPRGPTPEDAERPAARSPSPGLFVSSPVRPSPAKSTQDQDSDNDLPALKSDRFKALVERKRQERLAREAAEEARKAEQRARQEKLASELEQLDSDDGNDTGITDDEGGRKLTQEARPTRKASRRAIEEMNRETQRIARNMQLAHEARTRKKITKASLFERFNFRPAGESHPEPKTTSSSRPGTPPTDAEMKDVDTPPSSPPTAKGPELPMVQPNTDAAMADADDEELPTLGDVMNSSQPLDKGKGKAAVDAAGESSKTTPKPKRRVRVRLPVVAANLATIDSGDELEVTRTTKDKVMAVFDTVPANNAQESRSMKALRALALVKSPGKDNRRGKKEQPGMTPGELQALLYQRARQQAKLERDRRLELLKSQGIVIQTADERERQQQEVEDLVAKAREEAQKLGEEERAAARKERKESGEADPLAWDDSEDEEYQDSANEADAEASAVELSGSEDEEEVELDEDNKGNPLFDEDAEDGESEDEAPDEEMAANDDEDVDELPIAKQRRARNKTTVLSDDEADVEATPRPPRVATQVTPGAPKTVSPAAPTSVLRSAKKTFIPGLPVNGPAGLGLTQIFAGTMDDSQANPSGPTQSLMPDFDAFPDSNFSATAETQHEHDDIVMDSQPDTAVQATQTQGVRLNMSQSQMHGLDSLFPAGLTQASEPIEASQDGGLQEYTPIKERFVEPPISTVETIPLPHDEEDAPHESPLVRRGRLRRRMEMSVIEEESTQTKPTVVPAENAFRAMADAARTEKRRQLAEEFDRKKTKAKEMVEDQAEESEDEYAGLGGADGEDSDNDSQGSLEEMVDDDAANDVDSGKLAAFYADRERANDEKEVEKLFKDITTGMLRRKRGADYDLSDSDDGGEARRKMKRRQFAKMQKALFADERVKKIAENPGNQAFLKTIEDHGSDDEMDFLDVAVSQEQPDSQSQDDTDAEKRQETIPDSQPAKTLGAGENKAPAHTRRTMGAAAKKPSNIGEVRETLSSLLEERQPSVVPATEVGSDSEDEHAAQTSPRSDKENRAPNPRRTGAAIVDRISLKRNASSSSASGARLAFAAQATSSFKVPALLRRATTNSTMMSGSTASSSGGSAATGSAGGFGDEAKIKRGAGKRSGVNGGFAREKEPAGAVQESERRREQRKVKGAVRRVGVVGGLLGKGSFE